MGPTGKTRGPFHVEDGTHVLRGRSLVDLRRTEHIPRGETQGVGRVGGERCPSQEGSSPRFEGGRRRSGTERVRRWRFSPLPFSRFRGFKRFGVCPVSGRGSRGPLFKWVSKTV